MTMRFAVLVGWGALLAGCSGHSASDNVTGTDRSASMQHMSPTPLDTDRVVLHPLTGSGLRFNGLYDAPTKGGVHYFMRFFERGNVALVAGRQASDGPNGISSYLTENVQSGTHNVHNVPVTLRDDSIFFTTMADNGAITYAGRIIGDSLRFLKVSHVTGRRAVVTYGFIPDTYPSK